MIKELQNLYFSQNALGVDYAVESVLNLLNCDLLLCLRIERRKDCAVCAISYHAFDIIALIDNDLRIWYDNKDLFSLRWLLRRLQHLSLFLDSPHRVACLHLRSFFHQLLGD
jgi:hypothetical protein